jgi:hypothetical protein
MDRFGITGGNPQPILWAAAFLRVGFGQIQSGAEAHALHVLARLSNTMGKGKRDSVWSASGLPALWIGTARDAVLRGGH